jgi:hypothetical protein
MDVIVGLTEVRDEALYIPFSCVQFSIIPSLTITCLLKRLVIERIHAALSM